MPLYAASQPWRVGRPSFPKPGVVKPNGLENRPILREFAQGASI